MSSLLQTLIEQYLKDIVPPKSETIRQTELRAARIKDEYPRIYREILNNFGEITQDIQELQANSSTECCGEVNGGSASSIYLQSQILQGGNASTSFV